MASGITLLLLFYERNLQFSSLGSRRGQEVEGRVRAGVRQVRHWPPAQNLRDYYKLSNHNT